MRPGERRPISEPGLLGATIAKRYRRAQARKRKATELLKLRVKYREDVLKRKKNRSQLINIETRIRALERTLNYRKFNFETLFPSDESAQGQTGSSSNTDENQVKKMLQT